MKPLMRRIALAALLLPLVGCGTYVTVRHPWVAGKVPAAELAQVRRIYIVADRPVVEKPAGFAGKVAGSMLARALGADDNDHAVLYPGGPAETAMLEAAGRAMGSPWVEVAGWQVRGSGAEWMVSEMRPTAVLEISPGLVEGRQREEERETYVRKEKRKRKYSVAILEGEFSVSWRLVSWPGRAVLASGNYRLEAADEYPDRRSLREWLEKKQVGLVTSWQSGMVAETFPHPVYRRREVQTGKDGPLKSEWNAGIESEKAGAWEAARGHYRAALDAAKKGSDRKELGYVLSELDLLAGEPAASAPPTAVSWFGEPVAVMPFANETNNVAAAAVLRNLAVQRLGQMGYTPVPPAEIDARLRERGVSEGGQLGSLTPDQVAAAAGARRIIRGTVAVYTTVNVGVYYKREVRIRFSMSGPDGKVVWESVGEGLREVAPEHAGAAFVAGLVGKAVDKATGNYLKEEGEAAVFGGLATLPAR